MEGIFRIYPLLWKFQLSFIQFFKVNILALQNPTASPQEIPIPFMREVWIFSTTDGFHKAQ